VCCPTHAEIEHVLFGANWLGTTDMCVYNETVFLTFAAYDIKNRAELAQPTGAGSYTSLNELDKNVYRVRRTRWCKSPFDG